jgi:hypothetical protein
MPSDPSKLCDVFCRILRVARIRWCEVGRQSAIRLARGEVIGVNKKVQTALAMARASSIALFLSACGGSDGGQQLEVTGALDHPSTPTLSDLEALNATTQTVAFSSASASQTHAYTGTSLWGLLNGAGIQVDAARKNDVLNKYVLATGSDGYKAVFSLGEIDPDFGNRASIVAYAETIGAASVPLAEDGPFRVTSPGDVRGGRNEASNLLPVWHFRIVRTDISRSR